MGSRKLKGAIYVYHILYPFLPKSEQYRWKMAEIQFWKETMLVGQKVKLRLNKAQKQVLENYFGQNRFVYNKCVDLAKGIYDSWKKLRK